MICSEETFSEFAQTFVRPKFDKYVPLEKRLLAINDLESLVHTTNVSVLVKVCRDPKDDKFLSLALSATVDAIVSVDMDLLVLNPSKNIPIVTPADFLGKF